MKKSASRKTPRKVPKRHEALKFMEPAGKRVTCIDIQKALKIDSRNASTLLYDMEQERLISKEKIPYPKYHQPKFRYFIDPTIHRPELWRDDGLLSMMAGMDMLVRRSHENGLADLPA